MQLRAMAASTLKPTLAGDPFVPEQKQEMDWSGFEILKCNGRKKGSVEKGIP